MGRVYINGMFLLIDVVTLHFVFVSKLPRCSCWEASRPSGIDLGERWTRYRGEGHLQVRKWLFLKEIPRVHLLCRWSLSYHHSVWHFSTHPGRRWCTSLILSYPVWESPCSYIANVKECVFLLPRVNKNQKVMSRWYDLRDTDHFSVWTWGR